MASDLAKCVHTEYAKMCAKLRRTIRTVKTILKLCESGTMDASNP